jgi:hypothetical protein
MTPANRKKLEAKREELLNVKAAAIAKANQAQGALDMITGIFQLEDEEAKDAPAANSNGHDAGREANG